MATNDFKAFATAVDANVVSQADWAAASVLSSGFEAGIAESAQLNKAWRQACFMSSVLGQYMANITGEDVLDDGDQASKITILASAVQIAAGIRPTVIEPLSTPRAILLSEFAVGFARVAAPAITQTTLPAGAAVGQEFVVEDLVGNAFAFPIVVSPPGGHTISGLPNFALNIDRQSTKFRFYGGTVWSLST